MDPLPSPGTRLLNPFTGEVFLFTDVDETAESFRFDVLIEPGGMTTGTGRQHLHPDADETFLVRQGRLRLMVDGVWHELGPGQSMTVTKGVPHLFRNGHDGATWLTATFTPAQQFLRFFLNMAEPAEPPGMVRCPGRTAAGVAGAGFARLCRTRLW